MLNIGNNQPLPLAEFIEAIESAVGKKAQKIMLPMQAGDVPQTFADIDKLKQLTGLQPSMNIQQGMQNYVDWYRGYYKK